MQPEFRVGPSGNEAARDAVEATFYGVSNRSAGATP